MWDKWTINVFCVPILNHFRAYPNKRYMNNIIVKLPCLFQLRHAIQGNLDAEATRKHRPVVEEESEDDDYEDPQNLQVLHPDTPDGYTLVSNNRLDIESADEKEKSSVV